MQLIRLRCLVCSVTKAFCSCLGLHSIAKVQIICLVLGI